MVRRGRGQRWKISASVRARIFARLKSIDEASANRLLIPAINAYNQGDYQRALNVFLGSITEVPAFEEEVRPHIAMCQRVIHTVPSPHDIAYREAGSEQNRHGFNLLHWKPASVYRGKPDLLPLIQRLEFLHD